MLSDLVNKLAPVPKTKEDSIARNALLDVTVELYEKISENNGDLNILDRLDESIFNDVMKTYISSYIFQRFLNDLESRFEIYAQNSQSTLKLEEEIKEYICGVVENKLNRKKFSTMDYTTNSINQTIEDIYADCYEVIEGAI